MSGELASVKLRDLVEDPVAGFWGSSEKTVSTPVAAAVVRNGDVPGDRIVSVDELPVRWFSRAEIEKAAVHPDDTVVVSSGYIGKSGRIVGCGHRTVIASNFVRRLRARDGVDARWLFHLIGGAAVRQAMYRNAGGSTIVNLSSGYLDEPLGLQAIPTNHEQRCIAEILDTVDEAIRKTEQVIAKLQQMKQGLLHDLLTRGIDENGELRDPERHPEQFKDSPLGRIPRGWVVQSLSQCLLRTPQNGLYKSANDIGRGALMVGQTAFTATRSIDYGLSRRAVASQAEVASWGLEGGDILVSRVFATVDGVGQPVLVPDPPEPAIYESNMMRLKVDQSLIAPALVFHWLRHPPVRRQVVANTNSSNQSSINQRGLGGVQLGVPDPAEQSALLQSADAWDARLHRETTELAKLRLLKQGLMDDLLTGRVRVKVPTEER